VRFRAPVVGLIAAALVCSIGLTHPGAALGAEPEPELSATLDGKPIPLADVSKYFCDDFAYPEIRCSRSQLIMELRGTTATLLASVDYVTIFENPTFNGSWMNVSQDYGALVAIGWNDRISSYKARNSETGRFWTDWFNTGTAWSFCCNNWVTSLGSYDNRFSSIERT